MESLSVPTTKLSDELFGRTMELIPATQNVFAHNRQHFGLLAAPKYLQRGKGCHVWDVDGNQYIDLMMSGGRILLGYNHQDVDDAIASQLSEGVTFSLMHPLELEVAEIIHETIPRAEGVRFNQPGIDVRQTAIRLALAYTGRMKVLGCGLDRFYNQCNVRNHHPDAPLEACNFIHTFEYDDLEAFGEWIDESVCRIHGVMG